MSLHEQMAADLDDVFFSLDEFACVHEIGGRRIRCIVDDVQDQASTPAAGGFSNPAGLGLLQCDRVVYCQASDFVPQPLPGERIEMDGAFWLAGNISETEGLLTLALQRIC